jgi:hypothetical protein
MAFAVVPPFTKNHPLTQMPLEDLDFVVQFILTSGSLKEMARLHGVSYPTIRTSLDQVINRLQDRINGIAPDPLTDYLAELVERGEIKPGVARTIRELHRKKESQP